MFTNVLQMFYMLCTLAQMGLLITSSIQMRASDKPPSSTPFYYPLLVLTSLTAAFNIWRLADRILFHRGPKLLTFACSTLLLALVLLGYDALVFLYVVNPMSGVRIAAQFLAFVRLAHM